MKVVILNTVYKSKPNYRKFVALVDDADFDKVSKYKWSISKRRATDYAETNIYQNGKPVRVYLHKFITGFKQTDHIDGNGLNNQRSNLREASRSQNNMNARKRAGTSSRFKGVCWDGTHKLWIAQVGFNGKHIHLGYYKNENEAAVAYNKKARDLHGEFAHLNQL